MVPPKEDAFTFVPVDMHITAPNIDVQNIRPPDHYCPQNHKIMTEEINVTRTLHIVVWDHHFVYVCVCIFGYCALCTVKLVGDAWRRGLGQNEGISI